MHELHYTFLTAYAFLVGFTAGAFAGYKISLSQKLHKNFAEVLALISGHIVGVSAALITIVTLSHS